MHIHICTNTRLELLLNGKALTFLASVRPWVPPQHCKQTHVYDHVDLSTNICKYTCLTHVCAHRSVCARMCMLIDVYRIYLPLHHTTCTYIAQTWHSCSVHTHSCTYPRRHIHEYAYTYFSIHVCMHTHRYSVNVYVSSPLVHCRLCQSNSISK